MSKIFLSLLFVIPLLGLDIWDYSYVFKLKKDQVATVKVALDSEKDPLKSRDIKFRWTLYSNKNLIVLVNYDNFPTQYELQKIYKKDTLSFYLRDDYQVKYKRSFFILRFVEYSDKEKTVTLKVAVKDPQKRLKIIFDDPNKK